MEPVKTATPLIDVENLAVKFATPDGEVQAVNGLSFSLERGQTFGIVGESGSGKTTLLRIIAGFETADSGEIWMEGQRLDDLPPYRRRVNTVFQHYALFPHLTVEETTQRAATRPFGLPLDVGARIPSCSLPREKEPHRVVERAFVRGRVAHDGIQHGAEQSSLEVVVGPEVAVGSRRVSTPPARILGGDLRVRRVVQVLAHLVRQLRRTRWSLDRSCAPYRATSRIRRACRRARYPMRRSCCLRRRSPPSRDRAA